MATVLNSEANARRIALVESCFGASGQPLAVPGRVLVGEGVLTKMCRKKPKPRQVFLFNDILVYGNIVMSKKKYNQQHIIPLEEVQLSSLEDNGQHRNGWLIKTPTKSFAVYAATATEKTEWMAHINKCVQDLLNKSGKKAADTHAAVWVPDDAATTCQHCQRVQFNVIQRRHHCRKCGRVVCGPCSSKKILLPHQSSKPLRCCLACYDEVSAASKAGHGVNRPANDPDDLMEFDETIDESLLDAYLDPLEEDDKMLGDFASECDDDEEQPDLEEDEGKTAPVEAILKSGEKTETKATDKKKTAAKNVSFDSDDDPPEITGILTTDAVDAPGTESKPKDGESGPSMFSQLAPKVPKRFKKLGKMVTRRLSASSTPSQPKAAAVEPSSAKNEDDQEVFVDAEEEISATKEVGDDEKVDVDDEASLIENYYLTSSFVSYAMVGKDMSHERGLQDIPENEAEDVVPANIFGDEESENEVKGPDSNVDKDPKENKKTPTQELAASSQNSWKNPATVAKETATATENSRDAALNENSSDDDSDDDAAGGDDAATNPQMLQQTMMFYEGGDTASPANTSAVAPAAEVDNGSVSSDKLV